MSELISGKEAKLAWAEGLVVQVAIGPDRFRTLVSSDDLGVFDRSNYFRLKPHTVTINEIEVPAPFEPKINQKYFYLYTENMSGYGNDYYEENLITKMRVQFGAWRTEEEIKQVVVALRSIFNGDVK